ncbi:Uncharacterised protein [Mycobacteroides abscessus subsp. abscessus]|nr:Uncharacterised protein [Mycobacteroides abscessus subsp. abscessus]
MPSTRISAGASSARMTVASLSTASAQPMPNSFIAVTPEVATAKNTMLISSAAAVKMRPVRATPSATACVFPAAVFGPASHSSRIRDSRNTS